MTTLREEYYDSMHPNVPSLEQVKTADFFISRMRGMIEEKGNKAIEQGMDIKHFADDLLTEIGE